MIAAVPVPFDAEARIDLDAQERYIAHLAAEPVGGVCVWAHTGRGLRLSTEERGLVLGAWRRGLGDKAFVLAAAGAAEGADGWEDALRSARAMADQAAELGADALLIHPPTQARSLADNHRLILEFHDTIAEAGLPLILFLLYEQAGGVAYTRSVLDALLGRTETLGIKVATLDRIIGFQDVARLVREKHPAKVLITGEDRFLGYSLMCGAHAALIGMAAARTALQAALLESHQHGDARRFLELSKRVDELAQHTFVEPIEGYIQRMLWCLVHDGIIPREAAHDPWGPQLDESEFHAIGECLKRLPRE
jgi:4-hydroxy-tetrahydrodipicolinate synthase